MTGLDLAVDDLIEVAVVITDYELEPVHPGFSIVIAPSAAALEGMGDFVRQMHTSSGLLDELADGQVHLDWARRFARACAVEDEALRSGMSSPSGPGGRGFDRTDIAYSISRVLEFNRIVDWIHCVVDE